MGFIQEDIWFNSDDDYIKLYEKEYVNFRVILRECKKSKKSKGNIKKSFFFEIQ